MSIILAIVGIVIAFVILSVLFQLVLGVVGFILGILVLIGIVILTGFFPYIMIPLMIIGYLVNLYQESGGWQGMRAALKRLYATHLWIKIPCWILLGILILTAWPIVLPLIVVIYLYHLAQQYGGLLQIHQHFHGKNAGQHVVTFLISVGAIIGILFFAPLLLGLLHQALSLIQAGSTSLKTMLMNVPLSDLFSTVKQFFSHLF